MAQGFPDWLPPTFLKKALEETSHEPEDQYARSGGHLPLIKVISKEFSEKFKRDIDPMNEVSMCRGCSWSRSASAMEPQGS
jgi:aspartate/methionine/tyrosine aminotransferase